MSQNEFGQPLKGMVAVYLDEAPESGWFGYSGWFKRVIMKREFSIYSDPQLISGDDAEILKTAMLLYGHGRLKFFDLAPAQNR